MNTRQRILMIRLLEKAAKHPDYAKALGIEGETYRLESADDSKAVGVSIVSGASS